MTGASSRPCSSRMPNDMPSSGTKLGGLAYTAASRTVSRSHPPTSSRRSSILPYPRTSAQCGCRAVRSWRSEMRAGLCRPSSLSMPRTVVFCHHFGLTILPLQEHDWRYGSVLLEGGAESLSKNLGHHMNAGDTRLSRVVLWCGTCRLSHVVVANRRPWASGQ